MKKALFSMVLAAFLSVSVSACANGGPAMPTAEEGQRAAALEAVKRAPVPTLAQLETQLKQMEERYPKLVEVVQKMQQDVLILRGAIAREKQLKGEEAK